MKLIYIQSLSRSGSTFLQRILSAQCGLVCLGEVERILKNTSLDREDPYDKARRSIDDRLTHESSPCSCGADRNNCPFWQPLLTRLRGKSMEHCYRELLKRFDQQYPGQAIVDSSKRTRGYLKNYIEPGIVDACDVRVLFLIRDFRAWVSSVQRRKDLRHAAHLNLPGYHSYLADAYRWWYHNRKGLRMLERDAVSFCVISHEKLVFEFESEMSRILSFLEIERPLLSPYSTPEMHELYGSLGVKSDDKVAPSYDTRWLQDNTEQKYGPLLLPVSEFNKNMHKTLSKKSA